MGVTHPERPYVSRREFLRRAGVAGATAAAGPWFWRQLAYAADAPVLQRHLTMGRDAGREMTVSWMTNAPVRSPFVETAGRRVAARTVQYPGYPGFFHHARLRELRPGTGYRYRIGHDGRAMTPPSTFLTGPMGRAGFRFTAFGDQGVDFGGLNVPPISQPPNQASANTELARSMAPAFHAVVGDLAYANGDQAVWDRWFRMIEPMALGTPWMACIGNHEIETQLQSQLGLPLDSWGEWGYDPYRTRFAFPSNGFADLQNCFYGFRYGGVHFVSVDNNDVGTEIEPNIGYTEGRQRAWLARELAAARKDPAVDFIVVLMHQCAFSSSSKHGSDPGVQEAWLPLFETHSVDLVLQGHDHVYERTHGMRRTAIAQRAEASTYRTDRGTVFVTVGNGGAVQEPFQPSQPDWSAFRQALKVGTLCVDVEPSTVTRPARMVLSEHWALDRSVIESGIVLERPRRAARRTAA